MTAHLARIAAAVAVLAVAATSPGGIVIPAGAASAVDRGTLSCRMVLAGTSSYEDAIDLAQRAGRNDKARANAVRAVLELGDATTVAIDRDGARCREEKTLNVVRARFHAFAAYLARLRNADWQTPAALAKPGLERCVADFEGTTTGAECRRRLSALAADEATWLAPENR